MIGPRLADRSEFGGGGRVSDAGGSLLLSPVVAALFLAGRDGRLLWLALYWTTVVSIRAVLLALGGNDPSRRSRRPRCDAGPLSSFDPSLAAQKLCADSAV
jgi:hypothetical protein